MPKLHFLIVTIGAVLLLTGATACGGGSSEEVDKQLVIATELSGEVDETHLGTEVLGAQVSQLESRIASSGEVISDLTSAGAVHLLNRTAGIPEPPAGKVALHFSFGYSPASLPGDGIEVHMPSPKVNTIWAMESLAKGEQVPVGERLENNTLFLAPGEKQTVTLVYKNPSGKEVGWLAQPHQESPGALSTKTWLTCFCLSFIYTAPPEGTWYRVIGVAISPDMAPGSKVDARWTILTDPSVFPTD